MKSKPSKSDALLFEQEETFAEKRDALLERLKSKNSQYKYRRHTVSTLRYAGGKSLAVGFILELLPDDVKRVASPFFGGGSVEITLARDLGLEVHGYDIFDLLVNYWQHQIAEPEKLAEKLRTFEPSKDSYTAIKKILKSHWDGVEKIEDELDLAAIYYFNHNTSYGPHFLGHPSSVYLQEKRYETMVDKVAAFSPGNLTVSEMTFEKSIKKHMGDFIYADPPYFLGDDSKMFIGMYPHRNFPIHHNGFRHDLLRDLLHEHKGGFVLSYNDCPTIREWYKDFNMSTPEWQYTFSQGDVRIGENRMRDSGGSHIKKSHEILIWG
jgi:DNA adenine methylase